MFKKDDKVKVVKGIKAFEGLTGTVLDTNGNQVKVKLNLSNDSELQKNLINVFEAYQLELESLDLLKEDTPTFDNDVEPEKKICCICGEEYEGYGNNAEPYKEGRCCDECNMKFVIPNRLGQKSLDEEEKKFLDKDRAMYIIDYLMQNHLLDTGDKEELDDILYTRNNEVAFNHKLIELGIKKDFDKEYNKPAEESLKLTEDMIVIGDPRVEDSAYKAFKDGKTKDEWLKEVTAEFGKDPGFNMYDNMWKKVTASGYSQENESLKLTVEELKAWCSDNDANYYTQDIKDDKVIIRGLNEDLAEYDFKTKELKVFDYSGTTTPETKEDEDDDNYIRDYVYDIDMMDEKTEIPSWEFVSIIATAEDTTEDAVVTEAHDRGFKVFLITASEYEKLVVASEKITEEDIMDDFASYLEGNPKVTEVI